MKTDRCEVAVVGAGAAGGIVAAELATSGVDVVCLDKGPSYDPSDFVAKHDEIRYFARGAMVPGMKSDPITWREDSDSQARVLPWVEKSGGGTDPLHLPPSLGTGGGTLHWGGACWRFRESEFKMLSTIKSRLGVERLPKTHSVVDWPITYNDLEPYYDRVEWDLGISGKGSNIQGQDAGPNPWEAPRARDYPMPPLRPGAADARFVNACVSLGYHPFRTAAAIASVPFKGREACTYCGFCHGYPCHVGAKTSTHNSILPRGIASGNLEIREFCRVYEVVTDAATQKVLGVRYFDSSGKEVFLKADVVVLACYALENARLLLASNINRNGQVGKNLMTHAFGFFMGISPEHSNPFMGPLVASSAIEDFSGELIHETHPNVLWGAPIISWPGDYQPIEIVKAMPPSAPRWGSGLRDWMRDNFTRIWAMYSQTANIPTVNSYVDLDPKVRDPWGQPALRMTHKWEEWDQRGVAALLDVKQRIARQMGLKTWWYEDTNPSYHLSTHEVGTHRMGLDPTTAVVDPFGRSHEKRNLFVIGGGAFPTFHGYNPTETIMALAFMTSDHLLDRASVHFEPNDPDE